jgi:hypothetical protein
MDTGIEACFVEAAPLAASIARPQSTSLIFGVGTPYSGRMTR